MNEFLSDPRFSGIEQFASKVQLSSPTMHGDEQRWVDDAIQTNWVSTVGANINEVEKQIAAYVGCQYAVALSAGTAHFILPQNWLGKNCMVGQNRIRARYRDIECWLYSVSDNQEKTLIL